MDEWQANWRRGNKSWDIQWRGTVSRDDCRGRTYRKNGSQGSGGRPSKTLFSYKNRPSKTGRAVGKIRERGTLVVLVGHLPEKDDEIEKKLKRKLSPRGRRP